MVRLLDVDPDLGLLLADARREAAERELVVRTHKLPVGPWDVSRLAGATADHVGLLIIDGILSRELVVADHVSAELLGPGDLVRPWQPASRTGLLPVEAVWTVLSPLTVAATIAAAPAAMKARLTKLRAERAPSNKLATAIPLIAR